MTKKVKITLLKIEINLIEGKCLIKTVILFHKLVTKKYYSVEDTPHPINKTNTIHQHTPQKKEVRKKEKSRKKMQKSKKKSHFYQKKVEFLTKKNKEKSRKKIVGKIINQMIA